MLTFEPDVLYFVFPFLCLRGHTFTLTTRSGARGKKKDSRLNTGILRTGTSNDRRQDLQTTVDIPGLDVWCGDSDARLFYVSLVHIAFGVYPSTYKIHLPTTFSTYHLVLINLLKNLDGAFLSQRDTSRQTFVQHRRQQTQIRLCCWYES